MRALSTRRLAAQARALHSRHRADQMDNASKSGRSAGGGH
jgi:hypothetical protein